jgi:glycosyltransferase involved in cell wall biosynthesis
MRADSYARRFRANGIFIFEFWHGRLRYPSFFGAENLPPLEAFALGCPVIAADMPGAREQLGDAAILVINALVLGC